MNLSEHANPNCEECGGEGWCEYDDHHGDSEQLPCDVCFKDMTWEDFIDPDEDDGF